MSDRTPSSGQISFDNIRDTVGNFDNHATGRTTANNTNDPDGITRGSGTGVAMNEYLQYRDQRGLQRKSKGSNSNWSFTMPDASEVGTNETGYNSTAEIANTKPLGPFGHHESGKRGGRAYFNEAWTKYGQNFNTGQSIKDFYNVGNRKSFNINVGHAANIKGNSTNVGAAQFTYSYINNARVNKGPHNSIPSFVGRRYSAHTLDFNATNAYNNYKANKVQRRGTLHYGTTGSGNMGNITTPDGANWPIVAVGFVPKLVHYGGTTSQDFHPHFILMVQGAFRSGPNIRQLGWGTNSASEQNYWLNNYMNNTVATNSIKWAESAGVTVGNENYKGLFKGVKVNFGEMGRKYQAPYPGDATYNVRGQLSHRVDNPVTGSNNVPSGLTGDGDHVFLIGDNKNYDGFDFGTYSANANTYSPSYIASDHGINNYNSYTWEEEGSSWAGEEKLHRDSHYTKHRTLGHPDYSRWVWEVKSSLYDPDWFADTYGNNADVNDNHQQWEYIQQMWSSGKSINIEILEH